MSQQSARTLIVTLVAVTLFSAIAYNVFFLALGRFFQMVG